MSSVSVDDLPLAFSLNTVPQLASDADISREPVYADEPLMDMADDAIFELSEAAGGADAHTLPIRESAVLRQEIDEDGDIISGSDIIVERSYTMYDVYRGVKVADSFVTVSYDSDGVNSVINRWKDIYNEYAVEIITHDADQYTNRISEDEALSIVEDYALSMQENELFEVYSTDLAYALADENLYELAYEVDTSSGVYYVSIQTGNVL